MAGFVLLALVAAVFVLNGSQREVITPSAPASSRPEQPVTRADSASRLLLALTGALTDGTRKDALALAAPGEQMSRRQIGYIYDNVHALDVSDLSMRFVDEEAGTISAEERSELGPHAWVADVSVQWRVHGFDQGQSSTEVSFTLVDTRRGAAFGAVGGEYGNQVPLWLLENLSVKQSRRALVAAADPRQARRFAALADQAVRDVRQVLPRWRGRLVVEVPATRRDLDMLLDARPHAYDSIAAVTATVDGSLDPASPVHILVNPEVFGKLGAEGSQIVLSHEATHVAVDAATSDMPLWLLEGFADYVALARSDLPVSVTASQILAEVRKDGAPRRLPGQDEFEPSNKLLGTSYEAAWLACRLFAEQYGEKELIRFYDRVDAGMPEGVAFRRLGTSRRDFTRDWRGYLQNLAG